MFVASFRQNDENNLSTKTAEELLAEAAAKKRFSTGFNLTKEETQAYNRLIGFILTGAPAINKNPQLSNVVNIADVVRNEDELSSPILVQTIVDVAVSNAVRLGLIYYNPVSGIIIAGSELSDIIKPVIQQELKRIIQPAIESGHLGKIFMQAGPAYVVHYAFEISSLPFRALKTICSLPGIAVKATLKQGQEFLDEISYRMQQSPINQALPIAFLVPTALPYVYEPSSKSNSYPSRSETGQEDGDFEFYDQHIFELDDWAEPTEDSYPSRSLTGQMEGDFELADQILEVDEKLVASVAPEKKGGNVIRFTEKTITWPNPYKSILDYVSFTPTSISNSFQIGINVGSGGTVKGEIGVGPTSGGWQDIVDGYHTIKNIFLHGKSTYTMQLQMTENLSKASSKYNIAMDNSKQADQELADAIAAVSPTDSKEELDRKFSVIIEKANNCIEADKIAMNAAYDLHNLTNKTRRRELLNKNVITKSDAKKLKNADDEAKDVLWNIFGVPHGEKLTKKSLGQSEKVNKLNNLVNGSQDFKNKIPEMEFDNENSSAPHLSHQLHFQNLEFWFSSQASNHLEINAILEQIKLAPSQELVAEYNDKSIIFVQKLLLQGNHQKAIDFITNWSLERQYLPILSVDQVANDRMAIIYLSIVETNQVKPSKDVVDRFDALLEKSDQNTLIMGKLTYYSENALSQKSLEKYQACWQLEAENANWLSAIAHVFAYNFNWEECERYLTKAKEIEPSNPWAAAASLTQADDQYRLKLLEFELLQLITGASYRQSVGRSVGKIVEIAESHVHLNLPFIALKKIAGRAKTVGKGVEITLEVIHVVGKLASDAYIAPRWIPGRLPTAHITELQQELNRKQSTLNAVSFALSASQIASSYIDRIFFHRYSVIANPRLRNVSRFVVRGAGFAQTNFNLALNLRNLYEDWHKGNFINASLPITIINTATASSKILPRSWFSLNVQAFMSAIQAPRVAATTTALGGYLRYNDLAQRFSQRFGKKGEIIYAVADLIIKGGLCLKMGYDIFNGFFRCKSSLLVQKLEKNIASNQLEEAIGTLRDAVGAGLDKNLAKAYKFYIEAARHIEYGFRVLKVKKILRIVRDQRVENTSLCNEVLEAEGINFKINLNRLDSKIQQLQDASGRLQSFADAKNVKRLIDKLKLHKAQMLFEVKEYSKAKLCLESLQDIQPNAYVLLYNIALSEKPAKIRQAIIYLEQALIGYDKLANQLFLMDISHSQINSIKEVMSNISKILERLKIQQFEKVQSFKIEIAEAIQSKEASEVENFLKEIIPVLFSLYEHILPASVLQETAQQLKDICNLEKYCPGQ